MWRLTCGVTICVPPLVFRARAVRVGGTRRRGCGDLGVEGQGKSRSLVARRVRCQSPNHPSSACKDCDKPEPLFINPS